MHKAYKFNIRYTKQVKTKAFPSTVVDISAAISKKNYTTVKQLNIHFVANFCWTTSEND